MNNYKKIMLFFLISAITRGSVTAVQATGQLLPPVGANESAGAHRINPNCLTRFLCLHRCPVDSTMEAHVKGIRRALQRCFGCGKRKQ